MTECLKSEFCNILYKKTVLQKLQRQQTHNKYITVTRSLLQYFVGSGPETFEAVQTVPPAGQKSKLSGLTRSHNNTWADTDIVLLLALGQDGWLYKPKHEFSGCWTPHVLSKWYPAALKVNRCLQQSMCVCVRVIYLFLQNSIACVSTRRFSAII